MVTIEAEFLAIHSTEQISMARSLHVSSLIVHLGNPGPIVEVGDHQLTWTKIEFHGSGSFTITRRGVRAMRYERGALRREHPFPGPPPSRTELLNRHTIVGLPPARPPAAPDPRLSSDPGIDLEHDTVVVDDPDANRA